MAKKPKTIEEMAEARGMEDTLRALNIDGDMDPDDSARTASANVIKVVEDVEPAEIGDTQVPEPTPISPDPIPGAPEEKVVVPAATTVTPLPEPDPEPAAPALIPAPPPPKPRKRTTGGGTAKLGKGLAEKVPGSEKVKVYKREKDGKKWFISEYTRADLSGHTDFEGFITEYLKDEHGAGEYILMGVDALNRETEVGTVRLKGGATHSSEGGAMHVVQTMLQQQQKRDADYLERMEQAMQPQPQQNPLELLQGVMDLNDRVNGPAGGAAADAATATTQMMEMMSSSGDKSMQMMMVMMNQQAQAAVAAQQAQAAVAAQQQQMLMAVLSKPKEEDPLLKMLMMKLMKDDESPSGGVLPPPPPPPPAQPNTVEMITAIAGLLGATGGGGEEDGLKDYLLQQQQAQQGNTLSMKDIIELVTRKDNEPGTDDFRKSVDNMASIMNVAQNINRQNEGGPAAGIFDALSALFSNRDFAGSIANTIRAKTDQGKVVEAQGLDMAQQRLAYQQRLAMKQLQGQQLHAQRAAQMAAMQGEVPPQGAQSVVTPAPGQSATASFQGAPQGPPVPGHGQSPQTTTISDDQARSADAAAQQAQMPPLPSDAHTHINKIAEAKDDAERVGRTVSMLIYFSEFDDWRMFVENILTFIRDGNSQETLRFLTVFFKGFAEIHLIDPTLATEILRSIDEHFGVLQQHLREFELDGDREITGDTLLGFAGEGIKHDMDNEGRAAALKEEDGDLGEGDVDPGGDSEDPEPS